MPETEHGGHYITYAECKANMEYFKGSITDLKEDVNQNKKTNERILQILQGNGEGGLIWKVNSLMLRNVWFDRGVTIGVSILSTLLTAWLLGVFKL